MLNWTCVLVCVCAEIRISRFCKIGVLLKFQPKQLVGSHHYLPDPGFLPCEQSFVRLGWLPADVVQFDLIIFNDNNQFYCVFDMLKWDFDKIKDHLPYFSWIFLWRFNANRSAKAAVQISQWKGFSPEWTLAWFFRCAAWLNADPQVWHLFSNRFYS